MMFFHESFSKDLGYCKSRRLCDFLSPQVNDFYTHIERDKKTERQMEMKGERETLSYETGQGFTITNVVLLLSACFSETIQQ